MGESRRELKRLKAHWDQDRFLSMMDDKDMGLDGITDILVEIMQQTRDSRSRLKAVQMVLEVAGLKETADKSEYNLFIQQVVNMPTAKLESFVKEGLNTGAMKAIEAKEAKNAD